MISAEIEYFNLSRNIFADGKILSMDKLVQAYKGLLTLHRVKDEEVTSPSLKTKIKANVPSLEFSHPRKNKPELVCAKSTKDNAVGKAAAIQHD